MSRMVKLILACNLAVLTVLVFVYPNLMVGPGHLIPGHKALEADCFDTSIHRRLNHTFNQWRQLARIQ